MSSESNYVTARLEAIQRELEMLRRSLEEPEKRKAIKLEGLWKGVEITEEDIEEVKRSFFKGAYQYEEG